MYLNFSLITDQPGHGFFDQLHPIPLFKDYDLAVILTEEKIKL